MDGFCGNCGAKMDLSVSKDCPACGQKNAASTERFGQLESNNSGLLIFGVVIVLLIGVWFLLKRFGF
jgi:LPXTG-motif cell wall-anchored protein